MPGAGSGPHQYGMSMAGGSADPRGPAGRPGRRVRQPGVHSGRERRAGAAGNAEDVATMKHGEVAIGAIDPRPVVTADGGIAARTTCTAGLTVDHRAADGADAAR